MNTPHDSIWILIANSAGAKLYGAAKLFGEWDLVKEFNNPTAHERDVDITADRPGNYRTPFGVGNSAYNERTDPKQSEISDFARNLAKELDLGRTRNSFKKLVLVAPARFLGLLKEHSDEHTHKLILKQIDKDYVNLSEREVKDTVKKLLR